MVFENLTLFEIQLESAQFGPRSMNRSDESDDIDEAETGGRSRLLSVVVLAVVTIGAAMLYRRSRSTDVEYDAEVEDAESDLTTAQ